LDQSDFRTIEESEGNPAGADPRIQVERKESLLDPTRTPIVRDLRVSPRNPPSWNSNLVVKIIDGEYEVDRLPLSDAQQVGGLSQEVAELPFLIRFQSFTELVDSPVEMTGMSGLESEEGETLALSDQRVMRIRQKRHRTLFRQLIPESFSIPISPHRENAFGDGERMEKVVEETMGHEIVGSVGRFHVASEEEDVR
jgi:hypothetical protein